MLSIVTPASAGGTKVFDMKKKNIGQMIFRIIPIIIGITEHSYIQWEKQKKEKAIQ
jgi:hypothetical protein